MKNPNKILVVYPLLHQNAPDTTIVWVSEFAKIFEQLYNQIFQSTFELEIKSLPTEEEQIEEFMTKVDDFINVFVVLSPELLKNTVYLTYLKELYQSALKRSNNNGSSLRVFYIARKPVINAIKEDWLLHFPFYNLFEKSAGVRGFKAIDFTQRIPEESSIWEKLIDLAYDVNASISLAGSSKVSQSTIFIAETTADQDLYRDKIERELKHRGFKVLPETPLPTTVDDLKEELISMISKSDLTIHIMGGVYGDYIKSGAYSLIDLQNRMVRQVLEKGTHNGNLKRIIWIPPYLKIPDQRQELYLRRLKREETDEYTEIIQAPLEDLKNTINRTLKNKDKVLREKSLNKKSVYIIHDYKHTELIPDIEKQMTDQGLMPIFLDFSIENIVEAHFENLIRCDGVLIIYNGLEEWLNAKLNDLKKVWGYGRKKPFEIKAVLLKEDAYKDLFKRDLGDVMKLIVQKEMLQKTLQPFVNLIHPNENN